MQIEDGVEGVIVGGTTGESQLMSWDEHVMLIGHTVNCFGGVKECIGNDRIELYTNTGIVVWSGNDDECHDSRWDYGATGVISCPPATYIIPSLMKELMFEGKNPTLNSKLLPLIEWLFHEPNPICSIVGWLRIQTSTSELSLVSGNA
ncbi:4-hydroxy-tetrahydrodipicolinate synthase, chloroplastic-like [Primulina huaijiensis]|uniref:4-hydroxy-tetrahydrodipicolinate synthase, chloroplastic-like n=1 Tax=Primulina huaijiensis TaxID=1492673 RepID=UPI003CC72CB1